MNLLSLFMIALGLSMDAFTITIANAMNYKGNDIMQQGLRMALAFGIAQMLMPIIGYAVGTSFAAAINAFDHWIAFVLLLAIGGKMLIEGLKELKQPPSAIKHTIILSNKQLIIQAIATSIDALAVGVSFAFISVNIVAASAFIGVITFLCCMIAASIGHKFGRLLKQKAVIFGGLVLIFVGTKILLEHLL